MNKGRLEAFSDGVIAIMVLELKVPHDMPLLGPITDHSHRSRPCATV